ncbi:hypothetical protein GUITHDRAFT_121379 [Guillardia theta CCMP2712]|uniref:Uncharacterized protein n=1 Tax=Guillardia theta (strain CCMP2712) TaxID=905079 RepID=L1I968_GUITC|nr:hypothetical protein GUITHDRAFT_121379 [Guillardia theta CCMP2712]EKX32449.1 hypothetical protein GUITHDRAFT_121379 [Guillardia theta CCMP2712]|eukprot:XP_005819429.1 hypothetical protein GUITHDRAFT_121379 [Guillardia theta CCMP2712]
MQSCPSCQCQFTEVHKYDYIAGSALKLSDSAEVVAEDCVFHSHDGVAFLWDEFTDAGPRTPNSGRLRLSNCVIKQCDLQELTSVKIFIIIENFLQEMGMPALLQNVFEVSTGTNLLLHWIRSQMNSHLVARIVPMNTDRTVPYRHVLLIQMNLHVRSFMSLDNEKKRIMQDKMNQMIRRGMPAKFNKNDLERIDTFLRWEKDK